MNKELLESIAEKLSSGQEVRLSSDDFPAFGRLSKNVYLDQKALDEISAQLTCEDAKTFERAAAAIEAGELAWLGFKVVYDEAAAVSNVDNAVTKKYGETGSADGKPLVFFCNDEKEIVCSREPSARDVFQMKDVTRGPSMHNEQFAGLVWASVQLFEPIRVWLLGASDVASELSKLARHVGFDVTVADYDPSFINEERFPGCELIMLENDCFDGLETFTASENDYVCVLTRGHMFDPEGCLWASRNSVHYIGMMGCAGKNDKVYDLCTSNGMTDAQWDSIKRPIGLKFGAKTPAELAIAIVAELIDVRYRQRYPQSAREKHDRALGR